MRVERNHKERHGDAGLAVATGSSSGCRGSPCSFRDGSEFAFRLALESLSGGGREFGRRWIGRACWGRREPDRDEREETSEDTEADFWGPLLAPRGKEIEVEDSPKTRWA